MATKDNILKYYIKRKKYALEHYGNKCVCCGESNTWFLTFNHKNNEGYKLGRNRNTLEFIFIKDFPEDIELLCYNCNCGKNNPINKNVCPHEFN